MEHIVYLEGDGLPVPLRRPAFPHEWREYPRTAPEEVGERLAEATVAIVNKAPLSAAVLARLPRLKLVAVAATGTNNVDLAAARERGIRVTNIRGYAEHTVPEHVLAMLLSLFRNLPAYGAAMAQGAWSAAPQFCWFGPPIRDLHGATLGLVGRGSLGQGVARLAEAFGMTVLFAEHRDAPVPRPGYTAFAEVLARADALSLHCPLTDATRHLIGPAELAALKPGAVVINTGRGGLVDEEALAAALRSGHLGGAGVDVLSQEPPPPDHPLLAPDLLANPHFILTPHVAWASLPAMGALAEQLMANLEKAILENQYPNRVA